MEFLCYHRDRVGSLGLRQKLLEAHWSYMDGFAAELIARGPTFAPDETPSGSVHIAALPDVDAARAFAFEEPGYQAGMYRDILIRRYENLLGRTMWEFPGDLDGEDRHFVLGLGEGEPADTELPVNGDDLLAYGSLYSDDGTQWLGTAALVRAPDAEAARAILTAERYASIEVHPWTRGGRR
ncbi:hypothetical protein Afil01_54700 [Actinorhabdospora filicis]|uniref:YCII-related domain-containing protein n=1 Tax=Actinorhabdospora filicis TaxID=1785913 RepID=A0A9W6WC29_9ACTN|nr:YciI family protein [Actinorhabdospora filicis]GLZ80663.1 hypothetical protein Afil01_54700 [Actinorhabdospora filicis]